MCPISVHRQSLSWSLWPGWTRKLNLLSEWDMEVDACWICWFCFQTYESYPFNWIEILQTFFFYLLFVHAACTDERWRWKWNRHGMVAEWWRSQLTVWSIQNRTRKQAEMNGIYKMYRYWFVFSVKNKFTSTCSTVKPRHWINHFWVETGSTIFGSMSRRSSCRWIPSRRHEWRV